MTEALVSIDLQNDYFPGGTFDTTVRAAADLGFPCSLAQDSCATRALQFGVERVEADKVHLAHLAGLNGSFASVKPARELCAAL